MKDIDIVSDEGRVMSILSSAQSASLTAAMLASRIPSLGSGHARTSASVLDDLHDVTSPGGDEHLSQLVDQVFSATPVRVSGQGGARTMPPNDALLWRRLLADDAMLREISFFSQNFFLMAQVEVDSTADTRVVKMKLLEDRHQGAPKKAAYGALSLERVGLRATTHVISLGSLGFAKSDHVRVVAPKDSVIRSVRVTNVHTSKPEVLSGEILDGRMSVTGSPGPLDRAALHSRNLSRGPRQIVLTLDPSRSVFLVPGFITTVVLTALVGIAAYLQFTTSRFSSVPLALDFDWQQLEWVQTSPLPTSFDAAVTLLALAPSLIAVYLVRSDEHRVISDLMLVPRALVLLAALSSIVAAAATAAGVSPILLGWVYATAAGIAGIAAILLGFALIRTSYFRARARNIPRARKRKT